ncbi:MAG: DUF3089 domain-containing protein [Aliidongia sp.]
MIRRILWGLAAVCVVAAVAGGAFYYSPHFRNLVLFAPWHAFDPALSPPTPDYSRETAWLALPGHPGPATVVPPGSGAADAEATAKVDVFFIHPTTYFDRAGWNAPYEEGGETRSMLEGGVGRYQIGAFNGCCQIYAPRYRQATLYAFMGKGTSEMAALDFAYQDVLRAFDEFITHRNHGRPFILAGHSQGSLHGMRLLQERIAGTPLAHQLVAAYLVGYAIPRDLNLPDGIGPCRHPSDIGCYLTWNSLSPTANRAVWQQTSTIWLDKTYQPIAGRPITCVNPLTGTLDGSAPATANLGGLAFVAENLPMPPLRKQLTGAACADGVLLVTPPTDDPGLTFGVFGGNYHIYDYNLFYMNLRQGLDARIDAYLRTQTASAGGVKTSIP